MPLLNFVIMYDKIIKLSFKEEHLMEINDILEKFNFKGELEECNVSLWGLPPFSMIFFLKNSVTEKTLFISESISGKIFVFTF